MGKGLGGNLNKILTKPPMPGGKGKPQLTVVRVTRALQTHSSPGLFSIEVDHRYASLTSRYESIEERKKPDWFVKPGDEEMIIWFSQSPFNTIIIHKDVRYLLMQVKRGKRMDTPCESSWCFRPCQGHGAEPGFRREYNKCWVLKPVTLPAESEAWVNKHLGETL